MKERWKSGRGLYEEWGKGFGRMETNFPTCARRSTMMTRSSSLLSRRSWMMSRSSGTVFETSSIGVRLWKSASPYRPSCSGRGGKLCHSSSLMSPLGACISFLYQTSTPPPFPPEPGSKAIPCLRRDLSSENLVHSHPQFHAEWKKMHVGDLNLMNMSLQWNTSEEYLWIFVRSDMDY
jgi:hypothetical protein